MLRVSVYNGVLFTSFNSLRRSARVEAMERVRGRLAELSLHLEEIASCALEAATAESDCQRTGRVGDFGRLSSERAAAAPRVH